MAHSRAALEIKDKMGCCKYVMNLLVVLLDFFTTILMNVEAFMLFIIIIIIL
jgi:hypothetical protein